MKRYSYPKRCSASSVKPSAKLFFAAFCLALGGGAASLFPSGSTQEDVKPFRFDSFGSFSTSAQNCDEERPYCYLDASGRRVDLSSPRFEASPTTVAESTEPLTNVALPLETESVGATFVEAELEQEPAPFASAEVQTPEPRFENVGWLLEKDVQERENWSHELRLTIFPELTFAESSPPTWRDDVAVEAATPDELRALAFDPGVGSSSLVSPALRRRAANARLVSGNHAFAETSNASDANAPQTPNVAPQTPPVAPTRVGAFTACGAFDAYGAAKVRVQ